MFPMKKVTSKVDAESVFTKALAACIDQATSAGVSSRAIIRHLETRAKQLTPEWRPNLSPKMYDSYGNPIDLAAKVDAARRERQRIADEKCIIPPSQRQRAASKYRIK